MFWPIKCTFPQNCSNCSIVCHHDTAAKKQDFIQMKQEWTTVCNTQHSKDPLLSLLALMPDSTIAQAFKTVWEEVREELPQIYSQLLRNILEISHHASSKCGLWRNCFTAKKGWQAKSCSLCGQAESNKTDHKMALFSRFREDILYSR